MYSGTTVVTLPLVKTGHYYPAGGNVYEVPFDALEEKRANWVEFSGYGIGEAKVSHPAWQSLYEYALQATDNPICPDNGVYVGGVTPDGKAAHFGTMYRKRDGTLYLEG